MSPEKQIDWTLTTLHETVRQKGWPNSRRDDIQALVRQLTQQWEAYKAGALAATDPTVKM